MKDDMVTFSKSPRQRMRTTCYCQYTASNRDHQSEPDAASNNNQNQSKQKSSELVGSCYSNFKGENMSFELFSKNSRRTRISNDLCVFMVKTISSLCIMGEAS